MKLRIVRFYYIVVHYSNGDNSYFLIPTTEIDTDMLSALIEVNNKDFHWFLSYTYISGDSADDLFNKWGINYNKLRPYRVDNPPSYQKIESTFTFSCL